MALPLTSCQTPVKVSSLETVELLDEVADNQVELICEALLPGPISPEAFNASPVQAREKMAADAAAWSEVCA